MRRIGSQSGDGKAGCIFWVFVLLVVIAIGVKVIPVKISTMQLEDHMVEMARSHPRWSQENFEKGIANRAFQLRLEIPKDRIRVKKHPTRVIFDVQFTVPLDFLVYQYDWNVKIYRDLDIFLF